MDIRLAPGRYVIAVSGGVDSMVLLALLCALPNVRLTVAHFDHGIREDSKSDRSFVQTAAQQYDLPFVYDRAELGAGASEAVARAARYGFLEQARLATQADAIITAHHQDDLIETAILNLQRGTGRKGLTSLQDRPDIRRPLLDYPKQAIRDYAQAHGITWREDATNQDQTYRRNFIRHSIVGKLSSEDRHKLVEILRHQREINAELDDMLTNYLQSQIDPAALNKQRFLELPNSVAQEVMASWLRANGLANFDRKTIERAIEQSQSGRPGNLIELKNGSRIVIGRDDLALRHPER